jgi:hypothetical protein
MLKSVGRWDKWRENILVSVVIVIDVLPLGEKGTFEV